MRVWSAAVLQVVVVGAVVVVVGAVAGCNLLPVAPSSAARDCLDACSRTCPPPQPSAPTRDSDSSSQSACESDCVKRCNR